MGKQAIKSGTAVGALLREAGFAQSKNDFIDEVGISLIEANETAYRLNSLKNTQH